MNSYGRREFNAASFQSGNIIYNRVDRIYEGIVGGCVRVFPIIPTRVFGAWTTLLSRTMRILRQVGKAADGSTCSPASAFSLLLNMG